MSFNDLKRYINMETAEMNTISISILADSSTQFLSKALRGVCAKNQIQAKIFEADYNQIDANVFDDNSKFYKFDADYTILFWSSEKLLEEFYQLETPQKKNFYTEKSMYINEIFNKIHAKIKTKIIFFNFVEINDFIYGHLSNIIEDSYIYQIRKINDVITNNRDKFKNLFIFETSSLQNKYGRNYTHDARLYISSQLVFSLDFWPIIAESLFKIIHSTIGFSKKCLIFDLDNTIWGGVIGDDGLENIQIGNFGVGKAFTNLQYWILELQRRGIILAVVSKNELITAKEVFLKHPDMKITLDDIAIFLANWDNKVDNIKKVQQTLNISYDSMVFLDDNKFEREAVKNLLPEIEVPNLPEDPVNYLDFLWGLNLFDTISYSSLDKSRISKYKEESKRLNYQDEFNNFDEYLKDLKMISEVSFFNRFNVPRIVQLLQRSNQFNLRTKRYTSDEVIEIMESDKHIGLTFHLQDKFGDYGLISIVILNLNNNNEIFIDNWVMSCRVLKRGMEEFVANTIMEYARNIKVKRIIGEYIPTKKNIPVKNLFKELGFKQFQNVWTISVQDYIKSNNNIIGEFPNEFRKHNQEGKSHI